MTEFRKTPLTRRTVLGAGLAGAGAARHARRAARAGQVAEGRRLWRLLQGFLRQEHLSGIHQGDRHRGGIGGRADRRSLAGAARAGSQGRPGAGRPLDDVADLDAQGPVDRAVDADRHQQDQALRRPARPLRQQISGRPRRRHRGGRLVHHAGHQHQGLSDGARFLGGALGSGQCRQARPAGARLQLVPARGHGQDLSWAAPRRSTPRKAY